MNWAVRFILLIIPSLLYAQIRPANDFNVSFVNVAKQAGLTHKTIYGDEHKNKYLLETTGCGVAWFEFHSLETSPV